MTGRYAYAAGAEAYRGLLKVIVDCTTLPEAQAVRRSVDRPIGRMAAQRVAEFSSIL